MQEATPWLVVECDEAQARNLAAVLGVPVIIGRLLLNRGLQTAERLRAGSSNLLSTNSTTHFCFRIWRQV